jgi:tetratricopeptide (TPR) repeat protein
MQKLHGLMAGIAMAALAAACTTQGLGIPGFGESGGCKTIYVYRSNGGIQPISNCGGSDGLPRDTLRAQRAAPQALAELKQDGEAPVLQDANAEPVATPVSAAAKATAPYDAPEHPYASANEMIEKADMAAFMARVRSDFAKKENAGAWGYMIIDALAADDASTAEAVLNAMGERPPPEMLSANHLRPWVYAAAGRKDDALAEMVKARRILPGATLLGHRALLAEGMGDTSLALSIYDEAPDALNPPKPEDVAQPDYLARAMAFNSQRLLLLRQAELLRGIDRNPEAVGILTRLLAASPDDGYVRNRLEKARANEDKRPVRTLKQAMAVAISDESDVVEERQTLMGMMIGRGGKIPFNHLLSSLRQSALLLDPDNGDIRLGEVGALYQGGKFESALRIAQIGNPPRAQAAALWSTAGLAALELGSPDTLVAMTDRGLAIDSSPEAKVQAAGALTNAGKTDRALQLIDQALKSGLTPDQQVFAQMSKGQAHLQAGNVAGAVEAARTARRLKDDDNTKQFLASMLVEQKNQARVEGLEIMRGMLTESPDNTGLMNNFGYSLIDDYASDAELEEGFKMLKQAIRLTPDEPNLLDSIGWAYYQYGDFREAKRYIGLALEAYEPFAHWELSDHMGDVLWRLDEKDEARKSWQHSLDAYPPQHNKAAIEGKLKNGLSTPAPTRRDTPEVPLSRDRNGVSDI